MLVPNRFSIGCSGERGIPGSITINNGEATVVRTQRVYRDDERTPITIVSYFASLLVVDTVRSPPGGSFVCGVIVATRHDKNSSLTT